MGLDTTHDCWHGPYSAFMEWRTWINLFVMMDRVDQGDKEAEPIRNMGATREALDRAWELGLYNDQSVPINVLMNHSDCDGEIAADVCGPLADALQALIDKRMPARAMYDKTRPATERFIKGLRLAASKNEPVGFH
jgi:hypothetical protein